uniref:TT8L n=1 Tax=Freesia hybrid cultivar TaxID=867926 RepID=A0A291PNG7_9ASPA|nr:TT8L [Freesia hybrid cultivar]
MASQQSSSSNLQQLLQLVVQSVQWTYTLFWQICPQQGILVWGDGYYNGAIKTRKTVQPVEVSTEEASLQRSQQLRELYESLSAGETGQPARRPSASLSPEDLTETEWFYLMCVSFSFPLGIGLPGKALETQRHVWLTRANEADSKFFSRAILAKSANIQTVVCIPLLDGILELGTTEKVEEDIQLIQQAKSFFMGSHNHHPKPALSEHSTSNSVAFTDQHLYHSQQVLPTIQPVSVNPHESNQENEDDEDGDDEDEDGDDDENDDDDELEVGTDSDAEMEIYNAGISAQLSAPNLPTEVIVPQSEPSEVMQIEMSEGIRLGSPDDCSNNLDTELQMLIAGHASSGQSDHLQGQESTYHAWHLLHEDLCSGFPDSSGTTQIQDLSPEDVHYSETVSAVLLNSSSRLTDISSPHHLICSRQSAFSRWSYQGHALDVPSEGTSQWLLKYILITVPNLHFKENNGNSPKSRDGEGASRFRKGTPQEELSANHVLAERRRREKLNERFIILRSLVPFVTKMDKASILGDTIEYVKQLRRHIQDLESRNKLMEGEQRSRPMEVSNHHFNNSKDQSSTLTNCILARAGQNKIAVDKRKLRVLECGKGTAGRAITKATVAVSTNVQVSIIETDALLELQCPYRDGLLLQLMQSLNELQLEITSVQSSSASGTFVAEIRAKVREIHGKKASIVEVKKAIHHIFSQY